jgi:hypothetical protein
VPRKIQARRVLLLVVPRKIQAQKVLLLVVPRKIQAQKVLLLVVPRKILALRQAPWAWEAGEQRSCSSLGVAVG